MQRSAAELNNSVRAKRKQLDVCNRVVKMSSGLLTTLTRRKTLHRVFRDVSRRQYKFQSRFSCRILARGSDIIPVSRVPRHTRRGAVADRMRPCALGTVACMWMAYDWKWIQSVVQTGPGPIHTMGTGFLRG